MNRPTTASLDDEASAIIERLEHRRLCASVHRQPAFSVDDNGTLRISGSGRDDAIFVGGRNGHVGIGLNGRRMAITRPVRRAIIYGGAGKDRITCDFTPAYGEAGFPVYADGGTGNDTLIAGAGGDAFTEGDTLFGGSGDDLLIGFWGRNTPPVYLDGGPGDDDLRDGTVMHGGSGDDIAVIHEYFGGPIFTSGLEKLYDASNSEVGEVVVPAAKYVSTLATRDGRLVLSYLPRGREVHQLLAPYLRDDGRIGVTVTYDYPTTTPREPEQRMFVTFSERYAARARSKGIVLTWSGPAAGRPTDWEILLPQRG